MLDGALVAVDEQSQREFESRLLDTSTLAFRVAYSVLRSREDAEEVAQEAFARAYQRFAQLRDRDRFRAWLVRTTWRLAINRRRSDKRRLARETADARQPTLAPADAAAAQQRADELWRAIDRLPERLRVAIVLAGIEGHDVRAVARLLRVPEGTVKSRLFAARQRLRELLR